MTADAQREKDARAALRTHYGELGAQLEPAATYQAIEAGRMWTVGRPDEQPRQLPASFSPYSLHYRQQRDGSQLPECAPHRSGVCDSPDELAVELRRLRATDEKGAALAGVEPELG